MCILEYTWCLSRLVTQNNQLLINGHRNLLCLKIENLFYCGHHWLMTETWNWLHKYNMLNVRISKRIQNGIFQYYDKYQTLTDWQMIKLCFGDISNFHNSTRYVFTLSSCLPVINIVGTTGRIWTIKRNIIT